MFIKKRQPLAASKLDINAKTALADNRVAIPNLHLNKRQILERSFQIVYIVLRPGFTKVGEDSSCRYKGRFFKLRIRSITAPLIVLQIGYQLRLQRISMDILT